MKKEYETATIAFITMQDLGGGGINGIVPDWHK